MELGYNDNKTSLQVNMNSHGTHGSQSCPTISRETEPTSSVAPA